MMNIGKDRSMLMRSESFFFFSIFNKFLLNYPETEISAVLEILIDLHVGNMEHVTWCIIFLLICLL